MSTTKHYLKYASVTPYLIVKNASEFLKFIEATFNAKELSCERLEDGTVRHADYKIGDSIIMVSQTNEYFPPMPLAIYLMVDQVDATYEKALEMGCTSIYPPADQDYGHRSGGVLDAFGVHWWISGEPTGA